MGKQINQSIVIDAKVRATLEGMNDVVSKLNKGLRESNTKIDLTKGIGNTISKQIDTFKTEYQKFTQLTKNNKLEFGDSKEAIRSGEQMVKTFSELRRIVGNFEDLSILDAKKMFPDAFDSRVDALGKRLTTLRNNLADLDSKKLEFDGAQTALDELRTKSELLEKSLNAEMAVKIDTDAAEQELDSAKKKVQELREELKKDLGARLSATDTTKASLEARKKEILEARAARGITAEPLSGVQVKAAGGSKEAQAAATQAFKIYNAEKTELREIEEALKKNSAEASKYRKALTGADSSKLTDLADKAESSAGKIQEITNALERQEQAEKDLSDAQDKKAVQEKNVAAIQKNLDDNTKAIEAQEQKVNKLRTAYESLKTKVNPEELTKAFKELDIDFSPDMMKNEESVRQLQEELNKLDEADHQKLIQSLQKMGLSADTAEDYVRRLKGELGDIKDTAADISASAREMDNLKNQVLQFFSLTNSVQLFKRAVTSALNTVKELDKTMTEAAVVTEFDVSDMWDKLPQYAKHAQELGVSINGMYQATTLYYQQGLKTNEAMALGIETMKMGKIASMDSTEATKAMTAALRGFNMELNETSATRVNDVYSQLAAVTAADTNQIATAMEKTASIAAAANMEFESTAAFLAQIIETTQEAPETAGTALKTIIARFSEVKSLREQGLASGKDEEGEGIDVNKIQTALKTVGISMEGFFAGTEGLDSILMKLAEKWETLDFETQRYIATMAAGSRQQSRFIAMMSDYSRTAELVSEAQNSAGASTRQFEKTLESMESKLQRLENAWNEFLMGLANNEILKGAVDLVTSLVTGINDLTDGLSLGVGPLKTIVSLLTTLGALSLGKAALSGGLGWVGRQMGMQPQQSKQQGPTMLQRIDQAVAGAQKQGKKGVGAGAKALYYNPNSEYRERVRTAKTAQVKKQQLQEAGTAADFKKMLGSQKDTEAAKAAMIKYDETLRANVDSQDKVKLAAKAATEEFEKQGGEITKTAGQSAQLGKASVALGWDFKALGGTIMGVGGALSGLAMLFSAFGDNEAAEKIGKLAGIFMAVGSIVSVLGPMIQALGTKIAVAGFTAQAAWWPFLIITGVLIGIIALVAIFADNTKSAAEEMAELDSQTKALADAADKAEESMQRLADTQKDLADLKNTMSGLVKGTDEWNKALIGSNNKVLELLDTYPELAEFITEGKDGLLKISTEGWNMIASEQMDTYRKSSTAKIALGIKKTKIAYDDIEGKNDTETSAKRTATGTSGDVQVDAFYAQIISANSVLANSEYSLASATLLAIEGMEGFYDSLYVEEQALSGIKKDTTEGAKLLQEYSDIMGITIEEAQEADWDMVKKTVAAGRLEKTETTKLKTLNSKISKSEDKALLQALFSKGGSKLTSDLIGDIKERIEQEGSLSNWLKDFELTSQQLTELRSIISEVDGSFIDLQETLADIGLANLYDALKGQIYEVSHGITSKAIELQKKGISSGEISAWFNELISKTSNLTKDQKDTMWQQLTVTNWDSIEDIGSTFDLWAKDFGLEISTIEELKGSFIELTDAVSDNTVAQNQQKGFALKDIMDQILSGELTNVMTTAQKEALVNTGEFTEGDFQQTGTDQWLFNGDLYSKVVKLYGDIIEKNEKGVGNSTEEYNKATALKGLNWSGQGEGAFRIAGKIIKPGSDDSASSWSNWVNFLNANQGTSLLNFESWFEQNKASYGYDNVAYADLTKEQIDYMLSGYQNYVNYNTDEGFANGYDFNLSPEELIEMLQNGGAVDHYGLNQLGTKMAGVLKEEYPSSGTIEEKTQWILDRYDKYITRYDELKAAWEEDVIAQGTGVGSFAGTTAEYGYTNTTGFTKDQKDQYQKNYEKGIDTRYTLYGGAAFMDKIDDTRAEDTAGMSTDQIKGYDTMLKALASDLGQVSKKTKTFAENMSNLSENLNKSKRGTYEYGQALETAYANIGALFGEDAEWAKGLNLSDELLEALVKGDKSAFEKLQKIIQQHVKEAFESGSDEGMRALSNAELAFDMIGNLKVGTYLDGQQLDATTEQVLRSIQATGKAGQQAFAWMMQAQGLTVAYQYGADGQVTGFSLAQSGQADLFSRYSGGGGGGSSSKWKNPYDEFYNSVQKINEELRKREKLELRYQRLIDRNAATAKELASLKQAQLSSLRIERDDRTSLLSARKAQMSAILEQNADLNKYATYDFETGQISIDWALLEKLDGSTNEELTSRIEEYIDKIEEQKDMIQEEEDALDDIEDAVWEIYNQGKDEYFGLEDRVKEALIDERQKEIDKLSDINDSINDTNSKLLDSMQQQIDAYRQTRDNEKTEQEIADKQRRLSYLSQDTSGANALEIKQLQKEIDEAQEDYTDTLIDQKISELQQQNDQAAEQRQQQIDLQQAMLDQYVDSGEIWKEVHETISEGVDAEKKLMPGSRLESLLQNAEGFEGMSHLKKMDWLNGLETDLATGLAWLESGAMQSLYGMGASVTFTDKDGNTVTGIINKDGDVLDTENKRAYSGGSFSIDAATGKISSSETAEQAEKNYESASKVTSVSNNHQVQGNTNNGPGNTVIIDPTDPTEPTTPEDLETGEPQGPAVTMLSRDKQSGKWLPEYYTYDTGVDQKNYNNTIYKRLLFGNDKKSNYWVDWNFFKREDVSNRLWDSLKLRNKHSIKSSVAGFTAYQFKTGGLADFTGPAWLDGTKSKPEYILNADQTKAFFTLVDILSGLTNSSSKPAEKTGDNIYDIDINVESIGSDYDVEQIAGTIKRLIVEDAHYRNNNAINLMR